MERSSETWADARKQKSLNPRHKKGRRFFCDLLLSFAVLHDLAITTEGRRGSHLWAGNHSHH